MTVSLTGPDTSTRVGAGSRGLRGWGLSLGLFGILFAAYSALSLQRHAQYLTTGWDLGIFEQEVRSYASWQLPTSLLKGVDYPLLGDHFSPIVAVLAPIYLVFPHAQTLLVAQAALFAVAVIPLARWAHRAWGPVAAVVVGAAYGLSWGIASAVTFDFHEVAFAVPLVAFSLCALGQRRPRVALLWAAPLVLVKEDLGVTLAVIGALAIAQGARRSGLTAVLGGLAATALETFVLIPASSVAGANGYTAQLSPDSALTSLLSLPDDQIKATTLLLLLVPTAFVALRSPLLLVVLPTLAWRMASDNAFYWGTGFHYSAVLMPVIFAALIDGLIRWRWLDRRRWGTRVALFIVAVAAVVIAGLFPLRQLLDPTLWAVSAHVRQADAMLELIPPGVTVAASNSLAPHLTGGNDVSELGWIDLTATRPQFIAINRTQADTWPVGIDGLDQLATAAEGTGYRVIFDRDGLTLLRRP